MVNCLIFSRKCAGTHTSKFTCAIYCMSEIIVFSNLFYHYFIFPIGRTFPNKVYTLHGKIFCLNWQAENQAYTWLAFQKQIFCDFSSLPTEPKQFYEPIVDGIFKLFIYLYTCHRLFHLERKYFVMVQPTIYFVYDKYCTTNVFV